MARVPALKVTVLDAPGCSAPTAALPATAPPRAKFTVVAGAAAVPLLLTVADSLIGVASFADVGVQETPVTTRSGLGAIVPNACSSATWPPGAPVFEKNCSWTSAT